jgi:hypothetical protein
VKNSIVCVVLLCLSVFGGCAAPKPVIWDKPGATEEQFRRDHMNCRQYGMQSAVANGLAGNLFVESWVQQEAGKCLAGLGYIQRK